MDETEGKIEEADAETLGRYGVALIRRLGELGREGRMAIESQLGMNINDDVIQEGLAQLEDITQAQ